MLILILLIFLVQIFSYWIFEPLTSFLTLLSEIRVLPILLIFIFIFIFSTKEEESNT